MLLALVWCTESRVQGGPIPKTERRLLALLEREGSAGFPCEAFVVWEIPAFLFFWTRRNFVLAFLYDLCRFIYIYIIFFRRAGNGRSCRIRFDLLRVCFFLLVFYFGFVRVSLPRRSSQDTMSRAVDTPSSPSACKLIKALDKYSSRGIGYAREGR